MDGLSTAQCLRKMIHMAVGLGAFALPVVGPLASALALLAAVLVNLFVLPRFGGRWLWRADEKACGISVGMVFYPLTVLCLVVVFRQRLEVAAVAWAILALGDGMATVVGETFGRRRLPWNVHKTWAGSVAFWLFGTLGASLTLGWVISYQGRQMSWAFLVAVAGLAALFAAFLESQPQKIDDNLSVPMLSGLVLLGLLQGEDAWSNAEPRQLAASVALAVAVNAALAFVGLRLAAIDRTGALAGLVVGTAIFSSLGWRAFLVLFSFVALGTAATRLGFRRKVEAMLAQEHGGRRGARHALANTLVAAWAAVFAATTPHGYLYLPAFVAAFATATGDTLSSEIGQLWGRRAFLITTFEEVPRGTNGAISVVGTLAGLGGSTGIAVLGYVLGFYPAKGIAVVTVAAFVGTTLDSLLGATLERRGWLDNQGVNFLNTLGGALTAAAWMAWIE